MFEHSVKVPRLYKTAAKIVKSIIEDGASLKQIIYQQDHHRIKTVYALVVTTLQRNLQLDDLIDKCQLFTVEKRLDPWLARILITELLWGKKKLLGNSKPIQTILSYEQQFIDNISSTDVKNFQPPVPKVQKPRYVRVNTILSTVSDVINNFRDEGWYFKNCLNRKDYDEFLSSVASLKQDMFMLDIHNENLLVFPFKTLLHNHNYYKQGCVVLQDKASCLPVQILNPHPGSVVFDMCAAPGCKTSQIAALLNNEGTIYAAEMDKGRFKTLNNFIRNLGVTCAKTVNKDVLKVTAEDCPNVEYILVDPSCSGSGMCDRLEFTSSPLKPNKDRLNKLAGFQIMILKHALRKFPDAKRVVYSTCSIYPEENEAVVKEVIEHTTKFKLVSAKSLLKGPWNNYGSSAFGDIGSFCIYAKPEEDLTNGFFIAVFERLEEGENNQFLIEQNFVQLNDQRKRKIEESAPDISLAEHADVSKKKQKKKNKADIVHLDLLKEENSNCSNNRICSKKERKKNKTHNTELEVANQDLVTFEDNTQVKTKCAQKNKKQKFDITSEELTEVLNTLENNVIVKDKHKKKHKKQKQDTASNKLIETENNTCESNATVEEKHRKKQKKHKKQNSDTVPELITVENTTFENNVILEVKHKKKHKKQKYAIVSAELTKDENMLEKQRKKHEKQNPDIVPELIKVETTTFKNNAILEEKHEKKHKKQKYATVSEELTKDENMLKKQKKKHEKQNPDIVPELIKVENTTFENNAILEVKHEKQNPDNIGKLAEISGNTIKKHAKKKQKSNIFNKKLANLENSSLENNPNSEEIPKKITKIQNAEMKEELRMERESKLENYVEAVEKVEEKRKKKLMQLEDDTLDQENEAEFKEKHKKKNNKDKFDLTRQNLLHLDIESESIENFNQISSKKRHKRLCTIPELNSYQTNQELTQTGHRSEYIDDHCGNKSRKNKNKASDLNVSENDMNVSKEHRTDLSDVTYLKNKEVCDLTINKQSLKSDKAKNNENYSIVDVDDYQELYEVIFSSD